MCALYIYCIKSFLNVHYLMPIARVIKIDYIPAILELVFLFSFICTVVLKYSFKRRFNACRNIQCIKRK